MNPDLLVADRAPLAPATAPPWGRAAVLLGVFAAGLLATLAAVGTVASVETTSLTLPQRKLALLARQEPPPDLVFVGSSRVLRQVDPARFDRALADAGMELTSFNAAIPALAGLETEGYLERILALGLPLRIVVVDPEELSPVIPVNQRGTRRAVLWHDLETTWRASRGVLAAGGGARRVARRLGGHWTTWLARVAHVGELRVRWLEAEAYERALRVEELAPRGRGFMSLDEALATSDGRYREGLRLRRRELTHDLAGYARAVADHAAAIAADAPLPPFERDLIVRLAEAVRARGARPIFLVAPGLSAGRHNGLRRARTEGLVEHLLDYGDPGRHPELYAPENMFDVNHLDAGGAALFTDRLARDVAALLRAEAAAGGGRQR